MSKAEQGLKLKPCLQTFISGFNMRIFPLFSWKNPFRSKAGETSNYSHTDCMNSSFKVHFMLSVLTLGLIFIEEIEPYQFEIQN